MARVLLVDDEPMLRMALRQFLEFGGHVVAEANDGDDALAQLRNGSPDIVVSDVLMPSRDGMSLCRAMRADPALADVPFLFITARGTHAELYEEMERIGDGCVVKPFEPDELLATIARVVANHSSGSR
jgi:two-component system alkaline phosphatase synthesis response regulator PhoP